MNEAPDFMGNSDVQVKQDGSMLLFSGNANTRYNLAEAIHNIYCA